MILTQVDQPAGAFQYQFPRAKYKFCMNFLCKTVQTRQYNKTTLHEHITTGTNMPKQTRPDHATKCILLSVKYLKTAV